MNELLWIFLGGGLGSIVRFLLGQWVSGMHPTPFPWGTLVVNIAACLILGMVMGLAAHKQIISPPARLFWTVGFCGGFSTFSTFSYEVLHLIQTGLTAFVVMYIALSVMLCVAATFGGLFLGEHI